MTRVALTTRGGQGPIPQGPTPQPGMRPQVGGCFVALLPASSLPTPDAAQHPPRWVWHRWLDLRLGARRQGCPEKGGGGAVSLISSAHCSLEQGWGG